MPRNSTLIFSLLFLLAAVFSLVGDFFAHPWVHDVFTPLATICILCIAVFQLARVQEIYELWISIGLLFSLLGDVALLRPAQDFLPGLAAFLFAHIAYLIAFTRDAKFPARFSIWLAYILVAAILYCALATRASGRSEAARRPLCNSARIDGWPSHGPLVRTTEPLHMACRSGRLALFTVRRASLHRSLPFVAAPCLFADSPALFRGAMADRPVDR